MDQSLTKALRGSMKEKRALLSEEQIETSSNKIINMLLKEIKIAEFSKILFFYPLAKEVDLRPLCQKLLDEKVNVYFPKTEGKDIFFYRVKNLSTDFIPGRFNVMEPSDSSEKLMDYSNSLCITPGLVFDRNCNRIGYGGGFYDRFFANRPEIYKAGVAFDFQLVDNIEVFPHDIKLDTIVTETEIIWRE